MYTVYSVFAGLTGAVLITVTGAQGLETRTGQTGESTHVSGARPVAALTASPGLADASLHPLMLTRKLIPREKLRIKKNVLKSWAIIAKAPLKQGE